MKLIGLTGFIGSGKTTLLKYFEEFNFKIFIADEYIKSLNNNTHVIKELTKLFPNCISNNTINKSCLRKLVFKDYKKNIILLENIYHPYVEEKILKYYNDESNEFIIMEIPLILQMDIKKLFTDIIILKTDSMKLEKRILKRDPFITREIIDLIMEKQHNMYNKNIKDYIIFENNGSKNDMKKNLQKLIKDRWIKEKLF